MPRRSKEFKILSPTAILGYGFPESSFLNGMEREPDLIAVDAGSTDPGPYYLGSGKSFTDRMCVKRDLRWILREGVRKKIPVIVGSSGGSGARPHLDWCLSIVREIAREEKLTFRMGIIPADIQKETIAANLDKTRPLGPLPPLTEEILSESSHIVAQMGIEPISPALKKGCAVILCGRAFDPAVFAALPIMKGYDRGLSLHCGKILECAAIAADPGSGSDAVLGIIRDDCFLLETLSKERKFTKDSVAAHSLYEKSDPYHLAGPGGVLDLTGTSFRELKDGKVEVKGSRFFPSFDYWIKLEGARRVGYRSVSIAGSRDPIMVRSIDKIVRAVDERVRGILKAEKIEGRVFFHIYGKNAVMGKKETIPKTASHELGVVIEAVGSTQEGADAVCSITRSTLLHFGYAGRISTAGNLAFPFSPSDFQCGEVYVFSVYHLMEANPTDPFPLEIEEVSFS